MEHPCPNTLVVSESQHRFDAMRHQSKMQIVRSPNMKDPKRARNKFNRWKLLDCLWLFQRRIRCKQNPFFDSCQSDVTISCTTSLLCNIPRSISCKMQFDISLDLKMDIIIKEQKWILRGNKKIFNSSDTCDSGLGTPFTKLCEQD